MRDSKGREVLAVAMSVGPAGLVLSAIIRGDDGNPTLGESCLEDGTIVDEKGTKIGNMHDPNFVAACEATCAGAGAGDDIVGAPLSSEYLN